MGSFHPRYDPTNQGSFRGSIGSLWKDHPSSPTIKNQLLGLATFGHDCGIRKKWTRTYIDSQMVVRLMVTFIPWDPKIRKKSSKKNKFKFCWAIFFCTSPTWKKSWNKNLISPSKHRPPCLTTRSFFFETSSPNGLSSGFAPIFGCLLPILEGKRCRCFVEASNG